MIEGCVADKYAWSHIVTPYRATMLIICIVKHRHVSGRLSHNVRAAKSRRDENFKRLRRLGKFHARRADASFRADFRSGNRSFFDLLDAHGGLRVRK